MFQTSQIQSTINKMKTLSYVLKGQPLDDEELSAALQYFDAKLFNLLMVKGIDLSLHEDNPTFSAVVNKVDADLSEKIDAEVIGSCSCTIMLREAVILIEYAMQVLSQEVAA